MHKMRPMRSWSEIASLMTESSTSFRNVSIASSFSTCRTVHGKPSSTKLFFMPHKKTVKTLFKKERITALFCLSVLASFVVLELVTNHAYHDVV